MTHQSLPTLAGASSRHPATKMQETRNKMPAASVYLLENPHFLPFFVADSVPGSIILCKGDRE